MKKKYVICCFLFGVVAAIFGCWCKEAYLKPKIYKWRLESPVVYQDAMVEAMEEMQSEKENVLFWKKKRNRKVLDREGGRQVQVDACGIAGDSSILFPNANFLPAFETGHCLISRDVAWELFGSPDAVGKELELDGREYRISGILAEEEKLCVYELEPEDKEKVAHAAFQYEKNFQKRLLFQKTCDKLKMLLMD